LRYSFPSASALPPDRDGMVAITICFHPPPPRLNGVIGSFFFLSIRRGDVPLPTFCNILNSALKNSKVAKYSLPQIDK